MKPLSELVSGYLQQLQAGESLRAIEELYAEEVVVFENRELARSGKATCLAFEQQQLSDQPQRPSFKLLKVAVNEATGHVFLEYVVRFVSRSGRPMRLEEVAVQTWSSGKIVEERFYYEGFVDEGDE